MCIHCHIMVYCALLSGSFVLQNIALESDHDHETMIVPPRKRSRTIVYSGKKRPKCTKRFYISLSTVCKPHVNVNNIHNLMNM